MKRCTYCGRENSDEARYCGECGTEEFHSTVVPPEKSKPADNNENEIIEPEPDVQSQDEAALCTYCLFPNMPEVSWCKKCGSPMSYSAVVGPGDVASASGFMWRGALRGRPKPFVLLSVWILFLPRLLFNLVGAFGFFFILATRAAGLPAFLFFLWCVLGGTVSFLMLFYVTRNFLKIPKIMLEEP